MPPTTNPLQFGVNVRNEGFAEALALCQAAEEAGFDLVSFADRPPEGSLEGWTLATAIGARTSRLILTHNTLNLPFRNPALTAKMAASLDQIAGAGRVLLSLGAGGQEGHFRSYGLPFGGPGERVVALRDAITIMRGLWRGEPFSYAGKQHSVSEATLGQPPAAGTIPIVLGSLGPRMMALAGRLADGWLKNRGWPESLEQLAGLVTQLDAAAEGAGRDPRTLRRHLNGTGVIAGSAAEVERLRASVPQMMPTTGGLIGTPDQIVETVGVYREAGVDTFRLGFPPGQTIEQIRQFGAEALPKLRAAFS